MNTIKFLICAALGTVAFFIAIPLCVVALSVGSLLSIAALPFVFTYRAMTGSLRWD